MKPSAGLLRKAKDAAEALMVDTCAVTRVTGRVFDGDTGTYTDTTSTVYSGKCRVQLNTSLFATEAQADDRVVTVSVHTLHLPMSATGLAVDDVATVSASQDAGLVGRSFRVRQVPNKTFMSARRVVVEEQQS